MGFINSKIKIGLFYEDNLISIMTFGSLRKPSNKQDNWELLRFCNKLGYSVSGGASKLISYFIKKYNPKYILSCSDKSYSIGNVYNIIGFSRKCDIFPKYYWCKNGIKYNRYSFRKDILVKIGYDKNKTESEIMHELKYYKVYNCGNIKYELILN